MNAPLLLLTALVIAVCGLVYELLAGTLASYLLGDSVTQFSTVIGVYLSAMGLGLVDLGQGRHGRRPPLRRGRARGRRRRRGRGARCSFLAFAHLSFFRVVLYGLVTMVGALVGLEIPLLLRVLKDQYEFKDLIARVLTVDYLGALVASLLFPHVPRAAPRDRAHRARSSACSTRWSPLWSTHLLRGAIRRPRGLYVKAAVVLAILVAGLAAADRLTSLAEDGMYADEVIFTQADALPAHRDHARQAELPALPQRQPPVLLGRRAPLPRGARPPGARAGAGRRAACWCSAAATGSRRARS